MAAGDQIPDTQYASLGDDSIAYQVFGEGDVDLIYLPGLGDCIELRWDWPPYASFLRRLGAQARVIMFDGRGSGGSDAPSGETLPYWERWADEARVVLDAVTSEQAVIFGMANSGPTVILFAASHPARTRGLILGQTTARFAAAPDYPIGFPEETLALTTQFLQDAFGTETIVEFGTPDAARDPAFRRWAARGWRLSMRPREASTLLQISQSMDVRHVLASVRVPTLVIHRQGYEGIASAHGRYLAETFPERGLP